MNRICITKIEQPEVGALFLIHCPICKCTEVVINPWGKKPENGDYWLISPMCADPMHNLKMSAWRTTEPVYASGPSESRLQ
jgi:hypothetical protein